jgi:hypothetical protein
MPTCNCIGPIGNCPCLKRSKNPYAYWDVYENPNPLDDNLKIKTKWVDRINFNEMHGGNIEQTEEEKELLLQDVFLELNYLDFNKGKQPAN